MTSWLSEIWVEEMETGNDQSFSTVFVKEKLTWHTIHSLIVSKRNLSSYKQRKMCIQTKHILTNNWPFYCDVMIFFRLD